MSWPVWGAYVLTYIVVCLTPGPAVLFVTSQSVWRGRVAGVKAAAGIATANLVFWALSALGLAALIAASQVALLVLKWAGAAYLMWLGLHAIIGSFRRTSAPASAPVGSAPAYRDGLLVGLSNPKGILFFVALLPQFINPAAPALPQILILAATSVLIDFPINAGYGLAAGQVREALKHERIARWAERCVGGVFITLALATISNRRLA